MDLKTFAVSQKLHRDQKLLDYVVKQQDVPLHVIQETFGPLLQTQSDVKAERLIKDYKQFLADEIPILVRKNAENGFDISGDVPDTVLEVIELLHDVTADTAIRDLIDVHMEQLYGTTCDIVHSNLIQEAERTLLAVSDIPTITPVTTETTTNSFLSDLTSDSAEEVVEEDLADMAEEAVDEAVSDRVEDEVSDMAEEVVDEIISDVAEEAVEEAVSEIADADVSEMAEDVASEDDIPSQSIPDGYDTDLFDTGVNAATENESDDVLDETESEEAESKRFAQAIKRIYDKLVADIHTYGLDKQLNLQL